MESASSKVVEDEEIEYEDDEDQDDDDDEDDEEEELPEPIDEHLDPISKLRKQILNHRKTHRYKIRALEQERSRVYNAKKTIGQLISQITEYKTDVEKEKNELEDELNTINETLSEEKNNASILQSEIVKLEEEKTTLLDGIEKLEKIHEEALELESKKKNVMKQENVENLQTLMDELQRIEESNELLKQQHEEVQRQIKDEQLAHGQTLEDLIKEKELINQHKATIDSLKEMNDSLIIQLKQSKKASVLIRNASPSGNRSPGNSPLQTSFSNSRSLSRGSSSSSLFNRDASTTSVSGTSKSDTDNHKNMLLSPTSSLIHAYAYEHDIDSPDQAVDSSYKVLQTLNSIPPCGALCATVVDDQIWVGTTEGSIQVWEIQTFVMMEERKFHNGPVVAIVHVEDKVWSYGQDRFILIWSPKKPQPLKKTPIAIKDNVFGHSLLLIDQFVYSSCSDGLLRLWDSKSCKVKKEIKVDTAGLTSLIKRTNQLWIGTERGAIYIMNTTTLKLMKTLSGHSSKVNCFTAVGPFEVWSGSADFTVRCWNSQTHDCIRLLNPEANVLCLMQVRSQSHVWAGLEEAAVFVYDVKSYELNEEIITPFTAGVTSLVNIDKMNHIWACSLDPAVQISVWT